MKIEIDVEKTAKWANTHKPFVVLGVLGFMAWRLLTFIWYQPDQAWTGGQIIVAFIGGTVLLISIVATLAHISENKRSY